MARRRSNLGRRTNRAKTFWRAMANQTEEERTSRNQRARQRMSQLRAEETAERRAVRIEDARLRARELRSLASNLRRSKQNERNMLRMDERHQRQSADQHWRLHPHGSRDYNRLAFQHNPADDYSLSQHVLVGTMTEVCPYCKALKFSDSKEVNPIMNVKQERDDLHFCSHTENNETNDNGNNSNMCISIKSEPIDESDPPYDPNPPQSSSGTIRKNVRSGGGEKKKKRKVSRKYHANYLKFGFIQEPGSELDPRPLCVVCSQSLSNDAMKPSKLNRHFRSKHPDLAKKPLEYFQRLRENMQKQTMALTKMTPEERSLLKASYQIALQMAKNKKPSAIGEEFIRPCMLQACEEDLGTQASQKLKVIPMSVIKRRVEDMAEDIESQVIKKVKGSPFYSIQLDESIDASNKAPLLLCFVRVECEGELQEELLCSLNVPARTTSREVFEALNGYFLEHGIEWKKCVGICTDVAANTAGRLSGIVERVKNVAHPDVLSTHCIIQCEQLVTENMSPELHQVLSDVIKIINEIRHKALNSQVFEALCEEMASEHIHLLLHVEARWLSRGRILTRLFALHEEVKLFFQEQNNLKFKKLLSDDEWVAKLAYLADIFSLLNELNISLQGQLKDVFTLRGKMDAFQKKILRWQTQLAEEDLQMFPNFDEYMREKEVNWQVVIMVQQHLQSLSEYFGHYYPETEDPRCGNMWIVNPFAANIQNSSLSMTEKESLIDLSCDDSLKAQFQSCVSRSQFWLSIKSEYPLLSEKAVKILIQFSTTYLCEKTFSSLSVIKTQYRSQLEIKTTLRLAVTSLEPKIHKLISVKQEPMSDYE